MSDCLTCDLCDAHVNSGPEVLRVLPPVFHSYGGVRRFSGLISTVQCFEDNSHVKAAVEEPGQGRVLVVDGGGSLRKALFGGKFRACGFAPVSGCVPTRTASLCALSPGSLCKTCTPPKRTRCTRTPA
jgi:Aldolase/RraA